MTERSSYLVDDPRFPFCKGCGHTNVLRRLNEALVSLQLSPEQVVLVTDIGCIGLADALFKEVHTVHTTHGRSTAFATGIALADSVLADNKLKTIVLIGDGGAMIGLQHLVHAAMLNVDVTVLICNNFVYGMTGGQGSSLTPECFVTATTPKGNIVPPVDMCEILKNSNAPFVARALATDQNLASLLQNAIQFKGFSAVEILELCTEYAVQQNDLTGKKLAEIAANHKWKLGMVNESDRRDTFEKRYRSVNEPGVVGKAAASVQSIVPSSLKKPISIVLAGSAGEKVQSAAGILCQAAVNCGLQVTQKNDNPVTQGSGFSLSEIWLSPNEIHFTGIESPDFVIVTSEDGLREMRSQRTFEKLSQDSLVYIDDSLQESGVNSRYPFRKRFGASRASIGALVLLTIQHDIVDKSVLQDVLKSKFGEAGTELLKTVEELNQSHKQAADISAG